MGKYCHLPGGGRRERTKEEEIAYIDRDIEEIKRTDTQVEQRMRFDASTAATHRIENVWEQVEEDARAQTALC